MNKRVFGRKLSRERSSRELLFVSLVEALVKSGKIVTTKAKAKAVVGFIDRLVVLAKKETLSSKRLILKKLKGSKEVSRKIWTDIATTFKNRTSGFTRIIPLVSRKGDMAQMVRLEWVEKIIETKVEDKKDVKKIEKSSKKTEKKVVNEKKSKSVKEKGK